MVAGGATISSAGATTTIQQSTDRAVIHWQGFSIAPGETTSFVQPAASSAVLNRVTSGNASQLMGTLQANGQVYLLNPNGIFIGNGAVIDVGSFLATTHHTDEDAFMRGGELTFTGPSTAGIRNEGKVRANGGDVYLLARKVENEGEIVAEDGTVGLMAGTKFYLRGGGGVAPAVRVELEEDVGEGQGTGVKNTGLIRAAQARLEAAGNLYSLAVSQRGLVQATGTKERADGKIILSAPGGKLEQAGTLVVEEVGRYGSEVAIRAMDVTLDPSSVITAAGREGGGVKVEAEETVWVQGKMDVTGSEGKGGKITVTGARVGLREAQLDASGAAGGGEILLGGDFQGKNPAVRNAERAFVSADSVIQADAVVEGDGGKVITWSDEGTLFYGEVSARGGAEGGDGGLVEVSGRDYLDFRGQVNTLAPKGEAGMLLLDPFNLTINDVGPDALVNSTTVQPFFPIGSPSVLTWQVIENALGSGNVTVTTVGTPVPNPAEDGNITTADARTLVTSGNDLFLVANGSIDLAGGGLVLDGGGSLFLQALGKLGNGDITIGQAVTVNNGGGLFMEAGGNILFNGLVTINNGGDLSARSTDLTGSEITDTAGRSISGATTLHAGRINLDSASQYTGAVDIIARGSGSGGPAVQIVSADNLILGNVEITDTGTFVVPAAATVSQLSGEAVVIGGALFVAAGGGRIGNVTLTQELNDFNSLQVLLGTQLTVTDRDSIALAATTLSGNLTVTAGGVASVGAITQTGVLNIGGTSTLAAFGNVALSNEGNGFTGQVVVTRADNLSLGNLNALDLRVYDSVVDLTLSVGDIGFAAPVTATGVVTFQGVAPETAISLNNPAPAAGEFNLDNADLSAIAAGASRFVFGRSDQTGDLTVFAGAGPVTSAAEFRAGTGAFTVNSNLTVQGAMTVTADTVTFFGGNGSVTVAGAVTLQPFTPARTIGINSPPTASVDINYTGVPDIFSGETAFVFGRSDQTGAYDVRATTFQVPVTLRTANNLGQVGLRGTLSTTGSSLDIQGNLVLGADADLISGGTLGVAGNINGSENLDLQASGPITLGGAVGGTVALSSLAVTGSTIAINGGVVSTTGTQDYTGAVSLGANTTLRSAGVGASGNISFDNSLDGLVALVVNSAGTVTFDGQVGAVTGLTSLTTDVGGTTVINGGRVRATTQTYNDDVQTGPGELVLFGTSIFNGNLSGLDTNLDLRENTVFFGSLTVANLTFNSDLLSILGGGSITGPVSLSGGVITIDSGDPTLFMAFLDGLSLAGGPENISLGGGIQVSGAASASEIIFVSDGFSLRSDLNLQGLALGQIAINGSVSGGPFNGIDIPPSTFSLEVSSPSGVTFGSTIGQVVDGQTSIAASLSSLTVGSALNLNGGLVRTVDNQTYLGPVTLGANTVVRTTGANPTIEFQGTVTGSAQTLTLMDNTASSQGNVIFQDTLNVASLITFGGTANYGVSIFGGGAIGAGTTFANLGALTLGGPGETTTFTGGLTATAPSSITLAGGIIQTTGGSMVLGDAGTPISISGDTILSTSSSAINLGGAVNGPRSLTVNAGTGAVTLGGVVGGGSALRELTVSGGSVSLQGSGITTSNAGGGTGNQTYTGAVTLGTGNDTTVTLTATGGTVTLNSPLNATTAGEQGLVVVGNAVFGGTIGATSLASLSVSGTTTVNASGITTSSLGGGTGNQTYSQAVTLGSGVTFAGSTVAFGGTINGSQAMVVAGNSTFANVVGGTVNLASLAVTGTTSLGVGATAVTTSGGQSYTGSVTGAGSSLTLSAGGPISLAALGVPGGFGAVTISSGGNVALTGTTYNAASVSITAATLANQTGVASPFVNPGVLILTARPNGNSPSSLNGGFADFGYAFLPAPQVNSPGILGTMVYRFFDAPGVATPLQYTETAQTFAYTAAVPVSTYAGPRPFAGEVRLGRIEGAAPTGQPGGTVEPMEDGEIPPPPTQLSRTKPKYGSPFAKVLITEREKAKAAEAQEKSMKSGVGRLKVSDTVQVPPAEIRQVDGERLTQLQNR